MWMIVLGLIGWGIAAVLFATIPIPRNDSATIAAALFAVFFFILGLSSLLSGLKSYFLDDVLAELKRISGPGLPATNAQPAPETAAPDSETKSADETK